MDTLLAILVTLIVGVTIMVAAINAETIKEHWNRAMEAYANFAYPFQEFWWTAIRPEIKGLMEKKNPNWLPQPESIGYYSGDIVQLDEPGKYYMVLSDGVWAVTHGSPLRVALLNEPLHHVVREAGIREVYSETEITEYIPKKDKMLLLEEIIRKKIYG